MSGDEQHEDGLFPFPDTYTVLVSSIDGTGRIVDWINAQGESVWIVALKVDDITAALTELRNKGVSLIGDPGPSVPAKGRRVFVDATEIGGYPMQLIQR